MRPVVHILLSILSSHSLQVLAPFSLHTDTYTLYTNQAPKMCHSFWFLEQSADLVFSPVWPLGWEQFKFTELLQILSHSNLRVIA